MTADHVAYHAAERPDAVAAIHDGRVVSFTQLNRDIRRVMGALRALGVRPGGSVAVGTDDLYMHWLLLLACERHGIAAASFLRGEEPLCGPLWANVDLVMAGPEIAVGSARQHVALTPSWTGGVLAGAEPTGIQVPPAEPDDPVRIVRTSGTTGGSKRFLVTRRMHDLLSTQWQWGFALGPRSRYLQTLPLHVRATFDLGCACLRAGGTLVLESRMKELDAIAAHAITHAILLPIVLRSELDRLPANFVKPRELTIVSFGAALSEALRERAMVRLATALCDLYGTVEVGNTSAIWRSGTDGFGAIWPGVRAEVVDEHGAPLPLGELGRLRIKTDWMSLGYLDDPETTARMFRDGWFYPGDLGVIRTGGQLKVLGRADDLLNIGGQKILPDVLERALMRHAVAGDVGVASLPNADGIEELWIAVSDVGHDDEEIMSRILQALRRTEVGRFRVVKLDHIPRSANGKLQRQALRQELARRSSPQ